MYGKPLKISVLTAASASAMIDFAQGYDQLTSKAAVNNLYTSKVNSLGSFQCEPPTPHSLHQPIAASQQQQQQHKLLVQHL
ncbi:unnamed protein product [Ceratitis capitata]|uniref:(Mediterranean fruit fly) hypothetical protein n=1 Tax=Ceratitis capitata TaxID=7213 RepID=A0A811UGW5_CERCA|nr:unnamed protein product [Ceratitis capitata]